MDETEPAAEEVLVEIRDELREIRQIQEANREENQQFLKACGALVADQIGDLVRLGTVSSEAVDQLEDAFGVDFDLDVKDPHPDAAGDDTGI